MPKGSTAILFHTKIYVLGDRFNVTKLKDLSYSKITTLFVECGMVAEKVDMDAVMEAVTYAFGHLTLSAQKAQCSPDNLDTKEKLLVYMARYMAWAVDSFQKNELFLNLLEDCPDFAVALVFSSRSASAPPWSAKTSDESFDSTTHILSRSCSNCSYKGVMYIYCTGCKHYDSEVGLQVGSAAVADGGQRLSGTKEDFTYTCKWCKHKQICNSTSASFTDPVSNSSYTAASNLNSLVCRRCNMFGCRGKMTI